MCFLVWILYVVVDDVVCFCVEIGDEVVVVWEGFCWEDGDEVFCVYVFFGEGVDCWCVVKFWVVLVKVVE